ncbi:MAG: group 1 truncated hemoglobin [Phycisphaerae bacterium]|nr:group 1 truncated hemoglobin [Phycisphaerae bacterium]
MASSSSNTSLYEQLGGKDAIDAAVDRFYEKVLADDRIKHFFDTVDMAKQRGKQKIFMAYAFGGPVNYTGKDMRAAHSHLVHEQGLNDEHFDAVAENLQATLQDLGVAEDLIGQVMQIVGSTREDVLDR